MQEIKIQIKENKIFCPLKNEWHILTPEEEVRQKYIQILVNEYGYSLDQMEQEVKVNNSDRGNGRASADIIIWKNQEDKESRKKPLIIVECKSDNVVIREKDYYQGMNYASWSGAKFFVTHNSKETKFFQVIDDVMPNLPDEILNIPNSQATEKEIKQLLTETKAFSREEFTNLLKNCHNSIRNRDALDPASAFDEISKILFIKINFERQDKYGKIFTKKFIEEQEENFEKLIKPSLVLNDPVKFNSMSYIQFMFESTKNNFREDKLFEDNERIKIKDSTFKDIVSKLEKYNLSKTGDDVKGIAFEKFLGQTFRGEIGQFFTPRSVVDFIVQFLEPKEGQKVIDPASGSGGFLIKFFQDILGQIEDDIQIKKDKKKEEIEKLNLGEEETAKRLNEEFLKLNKELEDREWKLATECVYGTDKNSRMARTSKMNMIMHGDGHGGVHHHDGLVNVKNIEDGMFDLVITNPPFGASVFDEPGEITVLGKYDLGKNKSSQKTEILFIERCLRLLKPSGRIGIVLPEGILNNPSLQFVREYVEGKAKVLAIISLPVDTFKSAKASVKSSIIFLQKFSENESKNYENVYLEIQNKTEKQVKDLELIYNAKIKSSSNKEEQKQLKLELKNKILELSNQAKKDIKKSFNYPIFMAEVENSGITSTGETDSEGNELPLVIEEYKNFQKELFEYEKKNFNLSIFLIEYANFEERWDLGFYKNLFLIESIFKIVDLGEVLNDLSSKRKITILNNEFYQEPTISAKLKLISCRKKGLGKEFDVKNRTKILPGDLVIARLHTQNGLFAFSNEEFVSTSNFVPFSFNENLILKDYLFLSLDKFIGNLRKDDSVGRETYTVKDILGLKIPLPPLEIQEKIVKTYNDIKNEIESLESENKNLEKEVDNYLMKELGIEIEQKEKKKFFCVGYEDLERWDIPNFLGKLYKSNFQEMTIKEISNSIHRGKSPKYDDNGKYIAVSQKCVGNISFDLARSRKWNTENAEKIDKRLLISKDDILINSTGEGTIGRVCIISKDYENCITDSHVTTLRVNKNLVLPIFVTYYFNTIHGQTKLADCFSGGTKQKELTKGKFELISFPIPTLEVQEKIVNGINGIKSKNNLNQDRIEKLKIDLDEKINGMILEGKYL